MKHYLEKIIEACGNFFIRNSSIYQEMRNQISQLNSQLSQKNSELESLLSHNYKQEVRYKAELNEKEKEIKKLEGVVRSLREELANASQWQEKLLSSTLHAFPFKKINAFLVNNKKIYSQTLRSRKELGNLYGLDLSNLDFDIKESIVNIKDKTYKLLLHHIGRNHYLGILKKPNLRDIISYTKEQVKTEFAKKIADFEKQKEQPGINFNFS